MVSDIVLDGPGGDSLRGGLGEDGLLGDAAATRSTAATAHPPVPSSSAGPQRLTRRRPGDRSHPTAVSLRRLWPSASTATCARQPSAFGSTTHPSNGPSGRPLGASIGELNDNTA